MGQKGLKIKINVQKSKFIRQGPKDGDDLIFINSDAKRDAEDSVWRLLGPGSDSELIRPRCALRRGAACAGAGNTGLD